MRFSLAYVRDYFWHTKLRSAVFWILEIIAVLVAALIFAFFFCRTVTVSDDSMNPTLQNGDICMINTVCYSFSSPSRGDLIVFRTSEDEDSLLLVKRVIGLPGETIRISQGQILINGETYKELKGFPSIENPGLAEEEITLGSSEYFVLGDNRNNSEDSRHVDVGSVEKKNIVGKLWFRISPGSEIGFLNS